MTTLQTADGRLLRAQGPTNSALNSGGGFFPSVFPPMWSDGERYPNSATDGLDGALASYDRIYRSQPVLAGVIDMMAFRAATLPFGAFTANADGSRVPVARSDSLATLLRRPRPRASTVHLLTHIFTSLFVHGNALVGKLRTEGADSPPGMLWPLDWAQITAYGERGGDVEWWGTTQFGDAELYCRAEDTIHFAWPGPDGGQIGVSPLEKLGVTIRLEDAAQRYQTSNFRKGNRPALNIAFESGLRKDAIDRNLAVIKALHGAVDQVGGILATTGDTKVNQMSMTAVESSLIEQRRLDREEVAIVFGLSGPFLEAVSNSAMGNVVERFRAFYRDVLPPWATLAVETFEAQLLDPEPAWMDRLTRFDFGDKLRGEPREHAEKLKVEVEGGWVSRNEARKDTGRAPDGDPDDPENPANKLTMNVNNQAPLDEGGSASTGSPPS